MRHSRPYLLRKVIPSLKNLSSYAQGTLSEMKLPSPQSKASFHAFSCSKACVCSIIDKLNKLNLIHKFNKLPRFVAKAVSIK